MRSAIIALLSLLAAPGGSPFAAALDEAAVTEFITHMVSTYGFEPAKLGRSVQAYTALGSDPNPQ